MYQFDEFEVCRVADDMGDPDLQEAIGRAHALYAEGMRLSESRATVPIAAGRFSHRIEQIATYLYIEVLHKLRYGIMQATRTGVMKIFDPSEQEAARDRLERLRIAVEEEISWTEHNSDSAFDHTAIAELAAEANSIEIGTDLSMDLLRIWFESFLRRAHKVAPMHLGGDETENTVH